MTPTSKNRSAAFTLVEIMVAIMILFAVLAMIGTSFLHLYRASAMTALYSDLHSQLRHSVDLINRDIMCASGVSSLTATNDIALNCEMPSGPALVRYYLSGNQLRRSVDGANQQVIGNNIDGVEFKLFTETGTATTVPADARFVETLLHASSGTGKNSVEDMLQIRTLMRNK